MSDFIFRISPNIVQGQFVVSRIGQFSKEFASRYMVFIDSNLMKSDVEQKVRASLDEAKVEFLVCKDVPAVPDSESLENALKFARDAKIGGVIAVGSPHTTEFAKLVAAFYGENVGLYDAIDALSDETSGVAAASVSSFSEKPLSVVCVPTNLYDKFLFSKYIPLVDSRSRKTVFFQSCKVPCDLAIFDSEITSPKIEETRQDDKNFLTTLAFEVYTSQKANFFSDMLAEKSIELLVSQKYSEAGTLLSLAVSLTGLGPVSTVAEMVENRFSVVPAKTASIILPHFMEDAKKNRAERVEKIAALVAAKDENSSEKLQSLQISMEQLSSIATNVADSGFTESFYRSMTSDDIFEILKQAY